MLQSRRHLFAYGHLTKVDDLKEAVPDMTGLLFASGRQEEEAKQGVVRCR